MTTMQRTFVLTGDTQAQALWGFLRSNWRALAEQGKALAVIVTQHKAKRTIEQNSELHGLLTEIAEQAWVRGQLYSMPAWKEHYREKFVGTEELDMPDGTTRTLRRSTADLNVEEMDALLLRIRVDAATEHGVEFRGEAG